MPQRLLNKVAVVTGAGSGIGRAISEQFLSEGAKVALFARTRSQLEDVAAAAPARGLVVEGDVTRRDDLAALAAATTRRFGNIDVLVAAAGTLGYVPFVESTSEDVREQFDVNLFGVIETVRACLPSLNEGAAILFLTGSLTQTGTPGLAFYNAGKAALASLARTLAMELAPRRIRVNCLAPGPVATPLWKKTGLSPTKLKQLQSRIKERLPSAAFGEPADIAETAVFLASEAARNIVGQEIICDGGCTIG